ncbi:hypothetical protein CERSUDRAFT_83551 [Gelatoporia subvermispora B]|uniref:DUF6533 domain-containing protein n=1 Tax=Ceriporiopsis subvermispora (strain B) TaxID=914234 RepID=M2PMY1_CERS8|nr:hypothetical protein CERSUDRAFT_83551 [Gelatoporia subvermispora B]
MATVTSSGTQELLNLLVTEVRDIRLSRYAAFVCATIVIYDYLICVEQEVDLVWRKQWSIIKVVFLWHRYLGLFAVIFQVAVLTLSDVSDSFCGFWFRWETWGYSLLIFTSEMVLLLWIYVVFNKNRYLLVALSLLFLAEVAAVIAILAKSFINFHAQAHLIPGIPFCLATHEPTTFKLLWVPILGYDSILLVLFLYKGIESHIITYHNRLAPTTLLDMIYKHSLTNFLAIFASYLACAAIWLVPNSGLDEIPVPFALSLSLTNCTRLLLNIRQAYYNGTDGVVRLNGGDPQQTQASTLHSNLHVLEDDDDEASSPTDYSPPSIYAAETDRHVWQYELREMRAEPPIVVGVAM